MKWFLIVSTSISVIVAALMLSPLSQSAPTSRNSKSPVRESIRNPGYQSPCLRLPDDLPICPKGGGDFQLLPGHYPPAALFMGYASGIGMEKMLLTIMEAIIRFDVKTKVNIMFARDDTGETFTELYKLSKLDRLGRILNFIPARADESLWAQDYFIAGTSNGRRLVVADLPYTGREGDKIPEDLALSCRADHVSLMPYPEFRSQPGDYGGNIEPMPGGFLVVGNTLSQSIGAMITSKTRQQLLTVQVDWLETGHADEIISVVPDLKAAAPCDFAILYGSPRHALDIVKRNPQKTIKFWGETPSWQDDMSVPHPDYAECLSGKKSRRCRNFYKANHAYEDIVQREVKAVHKRVTEETKCKRVRMLPLPQLFYSDKNLRRYGTSNDRAQALNPNTSNLIAMKKFIVIASQTYQPFQKDITQTAQSLGLHTVPVDAAYYHHLCGGLHCISTVQRACRVP